MPQNEAPDRTRQLEGLLSEGLDLCVRARELADMEEKLMRQASMRDYETRSGTIPLWLEEQYQTDLADWEKRSRAALKESNEYV